MRIFIVSILNMMLLTGCSVFSPVDNPMENTYVIEQVNPTAQHYAKRNLTLLVKTPQANHAYDTTEMAYIKKPYQLSYFTKNSWGETPPRMLLPLMVQSLQNSGAFKAVVMQSYGNHYDVSLNTQLLELQQDFLKHPSRIQITLRAQLVNNNTQRVIATQQFSVTEAAPEDTPYGGVIAANHATAKLIEQLTEFCARRA